MKALAIIPAYNESGGLGKVVRTIRALDIDLPVLVVDDGSGDDTAAVAHAAGAAVVSLPFNMGYGCALQTGYKYALRAGYDYVVQLDADGQHEPADVTKLLAELRRGAADVVIGSRFLEGAAYRADAVRRVGMRVFRWLAYLSTGIRFTDVTSGFQALNRQVLEFFATERYPADYPDADVLVMLTRAGFRIVEIPVRMYPKAGGHSMHAGLRPIYYVFKMMLSMLLTLLRREAGARKGS